jgi:hypothetical protein
MAQIPTLSYVGSVDTTNSPSGVNMFRILFDSSITNVLMFEYQVLASTTGLLPPSAITTGFINPDSAQSEGIVNQWLVPVPSTGTNYDTGLLVRVRVYPSGLSVTEWSNALDFYNPPPEPTILVARYDPDYLNNDDLWVLLQGPVQTGISYLLAYYYYNSSNETVWKVSSLLEPSVVTYNGSPSLVVHTPIDGDVSSDLSANLIYVAAHAVFTFEDDASNNFYTVSEISPTVAATPAQYDQPVLEPINYNYNNQLVTLTWTDPTSSFIPFYNISSFDIYLQIDGGLFSLLADVSGNLNTYSYTNTQLTCGTVLSYYVVANSATGAPSQQSNTESINVFYPATAPLNLFYSWAINNEYTGTVKVAFSFQNPTDLGCGEDPSANWQIINTSLGNAVVESGTLPYNSTPGHIYSQIVDFDYTLGNQYRIVAFFSTLNNNPPYDRVNGAISESSVIVPSAVPVIYNIELIPGGVQFDIASSNLVSPIAQLVVATYVDPSGVLIVHKPFSTINYVPDQDPYDGSFIYEDCELLWTNLPISPSPTHFTLAISNSSGVGIGMYNQITP